MTLIKNEGVILKLMRQFLDTKVVEEIIQDEFFDCIYNTVTSFFNNLDASASSILNDLGGILINKMNL